MKKIYNNLTVENLIKTNWFNQFDEMQKFEIEVGIRSNVDVFRYTKKEFDVNQMRIIRMGLEANLDTAVYVKKKLTWEQMEQIFMGLFNSFKKCRRM